MNGMPILGLLMAIGAVLAAYKVGYSAGHADGIRDGFEDGEREGSKRGYAVGYERGLHADEDTQEEQVQDADTKNDGRRLIPFALTIVAVACISWYSGSKIKPDQPHPEAAESRAEFPPVSETTISAEAARQF